MVIVKNKIERVRTITRMVNQLTAKEQEELMRGLERKIMLEKASSLASMVKSNSLSMDDIVSEVRKVRHA